MSIELCGPKEFFTNLVEWVRGPGGGVATRWPFADKYKLQIVQIFGKFRSLSENSFKRQRMGKLGKERKG